MMATDRGSKCGLGGMPLAGLDGGPVAGATRKSHWIEPVVGNFGEPRPVC